MTSGSARAALSAEPDLEPVYFGRNGSPLFGCFHPASESAQARAPMVICQPFGQESIRCHRPLRLLASMLARAGVPVLRFDYYGCGDSLGDSEQATLSRCIEDVGEAVRFVRGRTRTLKVELFGVRLGGAIALQFAAAQRGQIERVALWDPIVQGEELLTSMREQSANHSVWMERVFGRPPSPEEKDGPQDFIGFRFSTQMIDELAQLDLLKINEAPCTHALILDNGDEPAAVSLHEHLGSFGVASVLERLSSPRIWLAEPDQALVPHATLEFITRWVAEPPT